MAYDMREVQRLVANSEGIVIRASIIYESYIGTGEIEEYTQEEEFTTLRSGVVLEEDYLKNGPTVYREHFSDMLADKDAIIGQPIAAVEASLGLSPIESNIAVT